MKRRFSKSESNSVSYLPMTKRLAALFSASSLLVFSATSCGLLEMRDATSEILAREETTAPTLQQAEKYSVPETKPETEVPETEAVPEVEDKTITLTLAGGIIVDETICADAAARAMEGKNYSFLTMYSGLYPLVHDADAAMVTLNSPAADVDVYGLPEVTHTNMPYESLTALKDLGFDVVNAAGTKRFDCGDEGLASTVANICKTELLQIGAYQDDIDAGDVRVLEVGETRIAFVSFTENANSNAEKMVISDLTDSTAAASLITYADLMSDVVIVSVTWDNTTGGSVREEQRSAAKMLTEAGADLVVGNDGLGLQTAEWLTAEDGSETFVVYSLGNLMGTGTDAHSVLGGLLTLEITSDSEDKAVLQNITIHPVVKHYNADKTGYQITELSRYTDEMAVLHGVGLTCNDLHNAAASIIPAEYLPGASE